MIFKRSRGDGASAVVERSARESASRGTRGEELAGHGSQNQNGFGGSSSGRCENNRGKGSRVVGVVEVVGVVFCGPNSRSRYSNPNSHLHCDIPFLGYRTHLVVHIWDMSTEASRLACAYGRYCVFAFPYF